ncbi:hypothetical protein RSAG8_05802, partial [Rhizoctonia solani AG-8 WAC10335]
MDALHQSDATNAQPTDADTGSYSSQHAMRGSSPHSSHPSSSRLNNTVAEPVNTSNATDVDEVPETDFEMVSDTSRRATHGSPSTARTYAGARSHNSQSSPRPVDPVTECANADNIIEELPEPNPLRLTPADLIRKERARTASNLAVCRSHLGTPNRERPSTHRQPRPPHASKGNATGRAMGGTRRLHPASAARNDLTVFNRMVAQGNMTSPVEGTTQQSEGTARRSPPPSHAADELLEDDEEMIAQTNVYSKITWPLRPSRIRKPKPVARDVTGIDRQVLTLVKLHLFAYALVQGIYQTRSRFLQWAADVHEATSQVELPDQPYNRPEHEIYEIMVNGIATRRGKSKENLREFVARVSGFCQNLRKHEVIQRNIDIFNRLYPNNFHCLFSDPRQGDYEHPEIGHCLALIIFHGPNSVGVLYPEYFREMPLTAVAFCLAIWQFCLEEWANGWRQNGDLGAGSMREKYEAQLARLNELGRIAPRRMNRLQNEWREYVTEYSGALLGPTDQHTTDLIGPPQMRPDTPEPDNYEYVKELNDRLLETARQESIRNRLAQIAAEELAAPMDVDQDLGDCTSAPPSRASTPSYATSTPVVEYNEHDVITARSKGKGRAN